MFPEAPWPETAALSWALLLRKDLEQGQVYEEINDHRHWDSAHSVLKKSKPYAWSVSFGYISNQFLSSADWRLLFRVYLWFWAWSLWTTQSAIQSVFKPVESKGPACLICLLFPVLGRTLHTEALCVCWNDWTTEWRRTNEQLLGMLGPDNTAMNRTLFALRNPYSSLSSWIMSVEDDLDDVTLNCPSSWLMTWRRFVAHFWPSFLLHVSLTWWENGERVSSIHLDMAWKPETNTSFPLLLINRWLMFTQSKAPIDQAGPS